MLSTGEMLWPDIGDATPERLEAVRTIGNAFAIYQTLLKLCLIESAMETDDC